MNSCGIRTSHPAVDGIQTTAGMTAPVIKMPSVAAIVCNFNQGEFVEAAIASVLQQTYPHLECVVVDDCSTDGSAEAIEEILARIDGNRFRYIRHKENRGQMATMLTGLDATVAPFVAWLDADDLWLPRYIERHIAHHFNPSVNSALSTSNLALIDGSGTLVAGADPVMSARSPRRARERMHPIVPARLDNDSMGIDYDSATSQPLFVDREVTPWIWSPTSGIVFRRATIELVRPAESHRLPICADYYLARFCHLLGGTILVGETLGYYRVHARNNFSKHSISGSGTRLGTTPKAVAAEALYQMARKLSEDGELLSSLMLGSARRALLLETSKSTRAFEVIRKNRRLFRKVPFFLKALMACRHASARLQRSISGRQGNGTEQP